MSLPASCYHAINKHLFWDKNCILSVIRGFRNGVNTGVRVRIPYIFQALIYAAIFRDGKVLDRVKFVLKQLCFHGRNLAMFVGIYKSICCLLRNLGIGNGIESLIAGYIGGFFAFGENKGVSGSVNTQIVLYLFARGMQGLIQSFVKRKMLPSRVSTATSFGFRNFAGIVLALALYLTEHEPDTLSSGFMSTMTYLYHKSDSGPVVGPEDRNFLPFFALVIISLFGYVYPVVSMENITEKLFGK
eukprot:TRINITY_DN610_c0_g1_i1.p1 TRINITY_DN610_c0_g1~~TRINITY_DN610_c0_g1_i1.p1  ORF type:complete len:244 (-),score=11.64 TRINITY_DN610_c0_g1_i1:60-791(-)